MLIRNIQGIFSRGAISYFRYFQSNSSMFVYPITEAAARDQYDNMPHAVNIDLVTSIYKNNADDFGIVFVIDENFKTGWWFKTMEERDREWDALMNHI